MNGILLLDKPAGWTSMDVCAKLRGALGEKRVGHSGTLDPMATGLLVVFLGRATRAVEFAEADAKTYEAALRLGVTTDTQDVTGTALQTCRVTLDGAPVEGTPFRTAPPNAPEEAEKPEMPPPAALTTGDIDAALAKFRGEILQTPPMYSAIKMDGQPLYKIARKGGEVERKSRPVAIYALDRTGVTPERDILLTVRCSKGTYVRTLCNDIGNALGCGGCMAALRRTTAGRYRLEDAYTLEQVLAAAEQGTAESLLLPLDTLFAEARALVLNPIQEKAVRNGGGFTCRLPEGDYRLYDARGEFLALARAARGKMQPVKSFFEVE